MLHTKDGSACRISSGDCRPLQKNALALNPGICSTTDKYHPKHPARLLEPHNVAHLWAESRESHQLRLHSKAEAAAVGLQHAGQTRPVETPTKAARLWTTSRRHAIPDMNQLINNCRNIATQNTE
jgi:hypothetical protein